jgi:hypothetical protein
VNFVLLRMRIDRQTGVVLVSIALILLGCQAKTAPLNPSSKSEPALKKVKVRFGRLRRVMRSNGSIQAVNALTVRVPQIEGQSGNLTLTKLIPGGSEVKTGDARVARDSMLPRFDLSAIGGASGLGGNQVPVSGPLGTGPSTFVAGGLGDALHQMFAFQAPTYGFAVNVTLPVHSSTAQAAWPTR